MCYLRFVTLSQQAELTHEGHLELEESRKSFQHRVQLSLQSLHLPQNLHHQNRHHMRQA